jgi:hypothetical protein
LAVLPEVYIPLMPIVKHATVEQLATNMVRRQRERVSPERYNVWQRWRQARYLRQLGRVDLALLMEAASRQQGG